MSEENKPLEEKPAEDKKEVPQEEKKKYIRSFGFTFSYDDKTHFIQGNLFDIKGKLDIDGFCDEIEYNSTQQLAQIKQWNEETKKKFVDKVQNFINYR